MHLPDLAIFNFSDLDDDVVDAAVHAVNRQVTEDFLPIWGAGFECAIMRGGTAPVQSVHAPQAAIYVIDNPRIPLALQHHAAQTMHLPTGFVFADLADWTVSLSHELLELIIDPNCRAYLPGPDPRPQAAPGDWVWHTYEVCDAVERTEYQIDGVSVSNFVTPAYFGAEGTDRARTDFLGIGVAPFGLLPNCHLCIIEPETLQPALVLDGKCSAGVDAQRLRAHGRAGLRPRASQPEDDRLREWLQANPDVASRLQRLSSFTRSGRKYQSLCHPPIAAAV